MKSYHKCNFAHKLFNMRLIQILFIVMLIACKSETATEPTSVASEERTNQSSNDTNTQGQKSHEEYRSGPADVKLNIKNVADFTSTLISFVAEGHFRVDSAQIRNGQFRFQKEEGYPQGLYYASIRPNEYVQFFFGEDQVFELEADGNNLIGSMKVKGDKCNEVFYQNLKYEEGYNPKYKDITTQMNAIADKNSSQYKALNNQKVALENERKAHLQSIFKGNEDLLFVKFKQAGQNPDIRQGVSDDEMVYHYRNEFWDNVDFSDSRLIRTPVIINKLKRYITELTPQNGDSIVKYSKKLIDMSISNKDYFKFFANWIALQYEPTKTTLMDPEKVFVNLVQNYFTRELAYWSDSMEVYAIQQRAGEMAQSLIGSIGPDVISTDQFGNTKSIYEKKAEYVIVYMYNPTCEHCMVQTPLLVDWYNKNKNNNRDVFAIAIDTNEDEWKQYINEKNMTFTNVFDPTNRSIYAKYYVDVTPEIYVLNKERRIIGKNLKVNQIETVIQQDKDRK